MQENHPENIEALSKKQQNNLQYHKVNGNLCLKKNQSWYYQVQIQLYVTGFKKCNFVIQNPKGLAVFRVDYDEEFTLSLVKKLKQQYLSKFVPEYFELKYPRDLKLLLLGYESD